MIDAKMIPLLGLALPIVIVPVALAFRHARYERDREHAERMKALELGRTLPQDESWWSAGRLSAAIGVGVPIGVFFMAWMAGEAVGDWGLTLCWSSAALVGLAGVVCGSLLAHRHMIQRERSLARLEDRHVKPAFDADAYDVVGRRG